MLTRSGIIAGARTPSLISASIRFQAPGTSSNAYLGQQIATNGYTYVRVGDRSVKAVNRIRKVYTTIGISSSITLASYINSARQEQGCGSGQTIRCHTLKNLTGTTLNQSGATVYTDTFNDLVSDVTISCRGKTFTMASKLDNTQTPPVYSNRTYAEFVADGGVVSSSTVNGASLANSQVFVPNGYTIITDEGPDLAVDSHVFHGLEQKSPIVAVTSITASDGSFVVNTSNTDGVVAGDVGTVASATGNTTVNGTWQVASVVANTSITMTASTATTGAVTGAPTLRFSYPTHTYSGQVTFNALGDYQKASASRLDVMGTGDWTSVGATSLADGGFGPGFAAIIGTDPAGGECVFLDGDSINYGVRDGQINDPSSALAGDAAGNTGFFNRALYRHAVPAIRVSTPTMSAISAYTKQDDQFRKWLCGFADVSFTEMGHNDVFGFASYSAAPGFKQNMIAHWNSRRASLRGSAPRVVGCSLSPLTAQLLSDKWTTGRNSTYQNQAGTAAFVHPGGYVYANYHVELGNGTLITGAVGGLDGYIDLALYCSNLGGAAAIDGYWPVDGTNYKYTTDGTHPSKDGHAGIDAQITRPVLVTAKVVLQ